jgi:hypothetical protein
MMIGDDLHGRVDADSFDRIIGELDHGSQDP